MEGRVVVVRRQVRRPKDRTPWLVGAVAMADAFFQAGDDGLEGRFDAMAWWLVGALMILALATRNALFIGRRRR